MEVTVRIPSPLREFSSGRAQVQLRLHSSGAVKLAEVFEAMTPDLIGVRDRTLDEHGALRTHMNVFVAGESIRGLDGMATEVNDGDEVVIFPAVSGGSGGVAAA